MRGDFAALVPVQSRKSLVKQLKLGFWKKRRLQSEEGNLHDRGFTPPTPLEQATSQEL
jgi:hypothetical protein